MRQCPVIVNIKLLLQFGKTYIFPLHRLWRKIGFVNATALTDCHLTLTVYNSKMLSLNVRRNFSSDHKRDLSFRIYLTESIGDRIRILKLQLFHAPQKTKKKNKTKRNSNFLFSWRIFFFKEKKIRLFFTQQRLSELRLRLGEVSFKWDIKVREQRD